jgi:hypothetical protein
MEWFQTGRQVLVFSVCRSYFDTVLFDKCEVLRLAIGLCVLSFKTSSVGYNLPQMAKYLNLHNESTFIRQDYPNAEDLSKRELELRIEARLDHLLDPLFRGALGADNVGIQMAWPRNQRETPEEAIASDETLFDQFLESDIDGDHFLGTVLAIQVWTDYYYGNTTPKFGKTTSMIRVLNKVVERTLSSPRRVFDLPPPDRWVDTFRWVRMETRKRIVWLTWNIETIGAVFAKRSHALDPHVISMWPLCDPDIWWESDLTGSEAIKFQQAEDLRIKLRRKEMSLTEQDLQILFQHGFHTLDIVPNGDEKVAFNLDSVSPSHSPSKPPASLSVLGGGLNRDGVMGLKWLLNDGDDRRLHQLRRTLAGLMDSAANWSILISFIASFVNQLYLDLPSGRFQEQDARVDALLRVMNDVVICFPPSVQYLDLNGDGKNLWVWATRWLGVEKAGVVLTNLLMLHEMRMRLKGQLDFFKPDSPASSLSSSGEGKYVQIGWFPESHDKVQEVLHDAIQISRLVKGLLEAKYV